MLRTRLWMGAVLVALTLGVLALDHLLAPWYPFLLFFLLTLTLIASQELLTLLPEEQRPPGLFVVTSCLVVALCNWPAHRLRELAGVSLDPWHLLLGAFTAVVLASFLVEMVLYRQPGGSVVRIGLAVWMVAYLCIIPAFLIQLRWLPTPKDAAGPERGVSALALAIFVPKACDIGAYFAGRFLGRTPMTPVLSPKKTLEGLLGGLLLGTATAVALNRFLPALYLA